MTRLTSPSWSGWPRTSPPGWLEWIGLLREAVKSWPVLPREAKGEVPNNMYPKLSQGHVQGYRLPFYESDRRGLLVALPPMAQSSPTAVKRAREASLKVKGARLFNLVPQEVRGLTGVCVDTFKAALDSWLEGIPDQPTIQEQRAHFTLPPYLIMVNIHWFMLQVILSVS